MNTKKIFQKARTPKEIGAVTQMTHLESPDDPRYVKLEEIRGNDIRKKLQYMLESASIDNESAAHIVYAGHRGNGKTTELFAFMKEAKESGYFFAYKRAYIDLAIKDLEYTDLMLYLARIAMECVCEKKISIDNKLLEPIETWFATETNIKKYTHTRSITTEGKIGFKIPGLLSVLTILSGRISGGHESSHEIRKNLAKNPNELISKINQLFDQLRCALKKAKQSSNLVLVVDNLDRHSPTVMDQAFSKWAYQFSQLQVHLIITMPIGLIYNPQGERLIDNNFDTLILPMPKIRNSKQEINNKEFWSKGTNKFIEVIQSRVDEEQVFFGGPRTRKNNMRTLVLASGGSLRELMRLLYWSGLNAWDDKITTIHIKQAIAATRREFMENFVFSDIPILKKIHKIKKADNDEATSRQLFYRFALEYNGEGWADVHPLVYTSEQYNMDYSEEEK